MRKRLLGSIAALAAGAGSAWGQPPVAPPAPAGVPAEALGPVAPQPPSGGPAFGGLPFNAIPGNQGFAPPGAIMPPGNFGPAYDPLGLGPVGGFGPPPSPTYPVPGPYGQNTWQPAPPGPSGGGGSGYGAAPRWWVEGEYLLWGVRGLKAPALLTTSAPGDAGIIGRSSTLVLAGGAGNDLDFNVLNGMRLGAGFFGDADRRFGFVMSGHFTEEKPFTREFGQLNSAGLPVLARPFVDVSGAPSALVLSGPDNAAAFARVRASTSTFGIEPAALVNLYRAEPGSRLIWSIDAIVGYRFLQVKEEISVRTISQLDQNVATPIFVTGPFGVVSQIGSVQTPASGTFGGAQVFGPVVLDVRDSFRVTNRFNGGVLGLKFEGRYGMFTSTFTGKVSLGTMSSRVEINGFSSFTDATGRSGGLPGSGNNIVLGPNGPTGANIGAGGSAGGVLANSGNIGVFTRDQFTAVPELGGTVGIALTSGMTAYVGSHFIFFPDVIRPGSLINPVVNSASIPGSANFGTGGAPNPGATVRTESLWIGGATFGLMFRY
jgi:hypothetical protein